MLVVSFGFIMLSFDVGALSFDDVAVYQMHYNGNESEPFIKYDNKQSAVMDFLEDYLFYNYSTIVLTRVGPMRVILNVTDIDDFELSYAGLFDYITFSRYSTDFYVLGIYLDNDDVPIFTTNFEAPKLTRLVSFREQGDELEYNQGYQAGYNQGLFKGNQNASYMYQQGYQAGYDAGIVTVPNAEVSIVNMLFGVFSGIGTFLGIELLPGVSFGVLLAIPIIFGLIYFFIGKRGGD